MKYVRIVALLFLAAVGISAIFADLIAPYDPFSQFREHAGEAPSKSFLLGTDDLGRDRLSRLFYATRTSLLLAPVTALIATAIAAALGTAAGWQGGSLDSAISVLIDLFLSLPWLFLLLTLRALLPLNAPSEVTLAATAAMLAAVGWAPAARVIQSSARVVRDSPCILHARTTGCRTVRLLGVHVLPNLRPAVSSQFWILVPAFLLTEANLGLLGLGVSEPMPSLGNLIAELRDYARIPEQPVLLVPALLLVAVVGSLHVVISGGNTWE